MSLPTVKRCPRLCSEVVRDQQLTGIHTDWTSTLFGCVAECRKRLMCAAKNENKPVDADHITMCLDASDDFAFEMQTLNVMQSANMRNSIARIKHGHTYTDPITEKPRQFDFRVEVERKSETQKNIFVDLAIECKRLRPDNTMVISRSARASSEKALNTVVSCHPYAHGDHRVTSKAALESFYRQSEPVGRSVSQICSSSGKPSNDSDIFPRWAQALSSLDECVQRAAVRARYPGTLKTQSILIPCLVVPDDTLWVVDYDEEGQRIKPPEKTDEAHIFMGKAYEINSGKTDAVFEASHLHVMTITGLKKLFSRFSDADFWDDFFDDNE